jgi:RNA polymerase sigma factor for flagellar operon FliA
VAKATKPPVKGGTRAATKTAIKTTTAAVTARKANANSKPRAAVEIDPTITVPPHVDDVLGAHWHDFKGTGSTEAREKLILHYAPLVKYVASRVATGLPASVEQADLVSYGMFGLMDALQKFEPGRGNKFETYAIPRIKGAIIDELRAMDWVPRSVRSRARDIERAIAVLEAKLHRAPTDEEIAEKLGITTEELDDSLTDISRSSIAALDELWTVSSGSGDQVSLIDTIEDTSGPQPSQALDQTEMREALGESIAHLPEREKLVITLYYYEELTLREIGEVLGVTESRVSQLHTKAILRLKAHLAGTAAAHVPAAD